MKIKITADSSCDLSLDFLREMGVEILPIVVILNGQEYRDLFDIGPKDIFDFVEKTNKLPKTAATSAETFKEFFKKQMNGGFDIIHFSLGSKLSATCANAETAAKEIDPNRISVIDSCSLSTGTSLLMMHALDLVKSGKLSAKEIAERVKKRIPHVQASFVVDTLEFLYKGGRCSMLAMFGANLLKIKPRLQLVNGSIISDGKYRGKLLPIYLKYVDDTLQKYSNPDKTRCFITHASADENLVKEVEKHVKSKNIFNEVIVSVANGTVTSHCGKGTLGILYINDGGTKD